MVALDILQVSISIKKIMTTMKANMKMLDLKISLKTSRKISTRKRVFFSHEKDEMFSDSDGLEEVNGEFLFMVQDKCKRIHEIGEKSKKENFDFKEDEEDGEVDLEGELKSALEELDSERRKKKRTLKELETLEIKLEI